MPRPSWRGHLRLSLVSCPIYLSPATARTKPIRLHQVWQPTPAGEAGQPPTQRRERDVTDLRASRSHSDQVEDRAEPVGPVSRITLRPHDPSTGEEIEKDEVVRGYEYERSQYVTFTPAELKALDLESSKVIDLETFVPRGEVGHPSWPAERFARSFASFRAAAEEATMSRIFAASSSILRPVSDWVVTLQISSWTIS